MRRCSPPSLHLPRWCCCAAAPLPPSVFPRQRLRLPTLAPSPSHVGAAALPLPSVPPRSPRRRCCCRSPPSLCLPHAGSAAPPLPSVPLILSAGTTRQQPLFSL
uniref:Uncharacterized protein n=1 Tax=Oryza meridionalis TaxID=40149 RepID=A0A0E0F6J9_9ORYZ